MEQVWNQREPDSFACQQNIKCEQLFSQQILAFHYCIPEPMLVGIIIDDLEHAMTDVSIRFSQVLADVRAIPPSASFFKPTLLPYLCPNFREILSATQRGGLDRLSAGYYVHRQGALHRKPCETRCCCWVESLVRTSWELMRTNTGRRLKLTYLTSPRTSNTFNSSYKSCKQRFQPSNHILV